MITEDQAFPFNAILSLENGEAATATSDPLEFWKEIAHEGQFVKDTGSSHIEFAITRGMMDHWEKTFKEMSGEGIQVPVPVEHTRDPEKRRGTVIELARKKNRRGMDALYAKIKFNDAEAAKLAKTTNVSIFVPKKVTSGVSKKNYVMPLEHLALTDYPVLHDLEPFQAIALSMTAEEDMTLRELATQAGIDPSITDEQQLILALSQKLQQLSGPKPPQPGVPGAPPQPGGFPRPPMRPGFGASRGQQQQQQEPPANEPAPFVLSGTLLATIKNARKVQLDALAQGPGARITPATRDALAKRFLDDEALSLSADPNFDDGFDLTLDALNKMPPIRAAGQTGTQAGIALSKGDAGASALDAQGADGPLAKAMAAQAQKTGPVANGRI